MVSNMVKFLFSWISESLVDEVSDGAKCVSSIKMHHVENKKASVIVTILDEDLNKFIPKYGCRIFCAIPKRNGGEFGLKDNYGFGQDEFGQEIDVENESKYDFFSVFVGKFIKVVNMQINANDMREITIEFESIVTNASMENFNQKNQYDSMNLHFRKYELENLPVEFDRVNSEIVESHYIHGVQNLNLKSVKDLHVESISKYIHKNAISKISLEVVAEWQQEVVVEQDVMAKIKKQFDGANVQTFTPGAVIQAWPDEDDLGDNYFFNRSKLEKIEDNIYVYEKGNNKITALCSTFDGELSVIKNIRNKRREVLVLEMNAKPKDEFKNFTHEKVERISLGNVAQMFPNWKEKFKYYKNEIVIYRQNEYTCQENHTSSEDFFHDLSKKKWSPQSWKVNTEYKVYDKVELNEMRYVCKKSHVSKSQEDLSNEDLWSLNNENNKSLIDSSSDSYFAEKIQDYDYIVDMMANYLYKNSRVLHYKVKIHMPSDCLFFKNVDKYSEIYKMLCLASPMSFVNIDDVSKLSNVDLSEQDIKGKIVDYKLVVSEREKFMEMIIAVSIMDYGQDLAEGLEDLGKSENLLAVKSQKYSIDYYRPDINVNQIEDNFQCYVEVKNGYKEQKAFIDSNVDRMFKKKSNSVFKEIGTKIKIKFMDLSEKKKLETKIYMKNIRLNLLKNF